MSVFRRLVGALARSTPMDYFLAPVVLIALAIAWLAVIFLPFHNYSRIIGKPVSINFQQCVITQAQLLQARRISRVVRTVATVTPWKSVCLQQAIVTAALLRVWRIPQITYFGVAKDKQAEFDVQLSAHAWVTTNQTILTGKKGHSRYTVVAAFHS